MSDPLHYWIKIDYSVVIHEYETQSIFVFDASGNTTSYSVKSQDMDSNSPRYEAIYIKNPFTNEDVRLTVDISGHYSNPNFQDWQENFVYDDHPVGTTHYTSVVGGSYYSEIRDQYEDGYKIGSVRLINQTNRPYWVEGNVSESRVALLSPGDGDIIEFSDPFVVQNFHYVNDTLHSSTSRTLENSITFADWAWIDMGPAFIFSSDGDKVDFANLTALQQLVLDSPDISADHLFSALGGSDVVDLPTVAQANKIKWNFMFTFDGGNGDDQIYGQDGEDRIQGGWGGDLLYGGAGSDWIWTGGSGGEWEGDLAEGGEGDDHLWGFSSEDTLVGGAGDDHLFGGGGRDDFFGDAGVDRMTAGIGEDKFWYSSHADSLSRKECDIIFGFSARQDSIDLSGIDAKKGKGNQAFKFIGAKEFSGKKGELRFKDEVLSADRNGDRASDFQIKIEGLDRLLVQDLEL